MTQWLRLCAPNAGGLGLTLGQRTRCHMPQLRPSVAKYILKKWKCKIKLLFILTPCRGCFKEDRQTEPFWTCQCEHSSGFSKAEAPVAWPYVTLRTKAVNQSCNSPGWDSASVPVPGSPFLPTRTTPQTWLSRIYLCSFLSYRAGGLDLQKVNKPEIHPFREKKKTMIILPLTHVMCHVWL